MDEWPKERDPPQIGTSGGSRGEERVCKVRGAEVRVCEARHGEVLKRLVTGYHMDTGEGRNRKNESILDENYIRTFCGNF